MPNNKWIIDFKNIYKTDLCDCLKRNAKGTQLCSRSAYKRGGLIFGIMYSLANGWAYIRGGLKVDFTVCFIHQPSYFDKIASVSGVML